MKKITCGIALIAALTLLGAPLAAHATEETEVASSESTLITETTSPLTEPTIGTSPTSQETTVPTATTQTVETDTHSGELPVETPQPIVSEATSPTTVAPSSTSSTPPTTSPKYILAVWENEAGSPKFPQSLVTSYATDSTNVDVLAQYTKCGTFYQSDLYANDERTAALIAGGVLNGGMESWPDGGTQSYDTKTTEPCVVVPQIQDYITCKGGAFVLDNTGSNKTVVYNINGFDIPVPAGQAFHTDAEGALLFQPTEVGYTITAADRTWVFPSVGNCPVINPPTEEPEEETPSPNTPTPTTPTVPTTPPVVTPPVTGPTTPTDTTVGPQMGSSAVSTLRTALKATGSTEVLPTEKPVTSSLAYTGANEVNNIGAAIAFVIILAGLFIVVVSRNRRP